MPPRPSWTRRSHSASLKTFLPWDHNRLIDEADDFISPDRREKMIKKWIDKKILLRSGDKYEWTKESMAPDLQRMTWSEPPGIEPAETFEARVAEFFNKVSWDVVL